MNTAGAKFLLFLLYLNDKYQNNKLIFLIGAGVILALLATWVIF